MGLQVTPVLECRNVSISYMTRAGEVPAVIDFNLTLMPGEAHGLVGESGCGKSTVALAIMRYLGKNGRLVRGEILFNGRNLATLGATELSRVRGAGIAMIYQEPMASLNPAMRIGQQLAEVSICHESMGRAVAWAKAQEMLERVRVSDCRRIMESYPHQLSGGQQQRIVIAMALLSNPQLLLLDEPTTALDVTVEAGIVDLIRDISAQFGTSMLYISHNLGLVLETCNRVTVMYSGEAVEVGPVHAVFEHPRHPYTRGLFASIPIPSGNKDNRPLFAIPGQLPAPRDRPRGCKFGPRCGFFAADCCDAKAVELVPLADHHECRCARLEEISRSYAASEGEVKPRSALGEVVLTVHDLSKNYGSVRANHRLNFDARHGETVAIVGESGCGKSTFARILMGLEQATSGSVKFGELELGTLPVTRRKHSVIRRLQMIFQNPFDTLNPSHTVGFQIARVIRKVGGEKDEAKIRERVLELLDIVKLPREYANRRPRQLSGGQKQRIAIARAFAGNPSLVVADEPVSALDVSVQASVITLLMDIQRQQGTTIVFISHDLSVVRYLSDRVVVMYLGMIMEQGRTDDVFSPPYHPYTEALLSSVPIADLRIRKRKVPLIGDQPSSSSPPAGCPFSTRCSYKIPGTCDTQEPASQEFSHGHRIACHLPREHLLSMEPVISMVGGQ